eukprot:gnl/TRDRNA2_/TRDRNA2_175514_c1_seq4.p1 gnl/TRDRNA2_/TRDRNA2_175514_c1~~gnl/TRDRNA2_/TRDRNA2_175514_c1_seq4.p1  ORF type:complete len:371 (+),score=64.60 gnl/TRDRNA2_/TRDRNA2_175514_c1_seq4:419-1531(+)
MDDGKPAENVGGMPADPALWGITVKQLYDFGAKVFGSHENLFNAAMEVIEHGRGGFTGDKGDISKCSQNQFGEWIFDGEPPMSAEAKINMYDVVKNYVKPMTLGTSQSLSVMLNAKKPQKATIFISHSWAEKFAYFVFVICFDMFHMKFFFKHAQKPKYRESDIVQQCGPLGLKEMYGKIIGAHQNGLKFTAESVVWICALAINQNADIAAEVGGGDVMKSPFAVVLAQTSHMLVLYNSNIDLYTRIWCVLEIFIAHNKKQNDRDFQLSVIGMPPRKMTADFANFIGHHKMRQLWDASTNTDKLSRYAEPWIREFCTKTPMYVENASASVEKDRVMILNHIKNHKKECNQLVKTMRETLLSSSLFLLAND